MKTTSPIPITQEEKEVFLRLLSDPDTPEKFKEAFRIVFGLSIPDPQEDTKKNYGRRLARTKRETEEQARKAQEEEAKREAHIEEVTSMDLPLDWENIFNSDTRTQGVHADSISDGLILSLTNLGKVDIEYISSVTGEDYKTVILTLNGSIFQNPETWGECFYKGWETSEEYLSGNLMRKWKAAKEANEAYHGYFSDNLAAIEKVLPPTVAAEDIYVTLGSPWVPADIIDDFILQLLGDPLKNIIYRNQQQKDAVMESYKTVHDEFTGTWEIPNKNRYYYNTAASQNYGTNRLGALYILERTLNMKAVTVTDEVRTNTTASGVKRVVNKAETVAALEKQQKLIAAFQKWVWKDPQRKERLETIFENNFSSVRRRIFDGSFLTFPTMSDSVTLFPYQKDAVARILFTPNTLLAHDVGAGKTYVMIAAGQELRRMGLSKKNLFVVPNNIVGQWGSIFLSMYPDAKLLTVAPKDFTPGKRRKVLERIRDEEFDGIIMAYSSFGLIPLSKEYYIEDLEEQREKVLSLLKQKGKATAKLKRKLDSINAEILKRREEKEQDVPFFDDLGITRLFVDEAHNFKNVPIDTKNNNVLGISSSGSKHCQDMMDKVHMVQKRNGGKGVVFATGTPITNSITDAFVLQKYLQDGELAMLDLQNFDAWTGMFAERCTEFEIDVDTSSYRLATRFSRFHNLPELTALLSSVADFHSMEGTIGIPEHDGYQDALLSKTCDFQQYLNEISVRADMVRQGMVSRTEDNMLKITTDGRKAALDLRLVDPGAPFSFQSKVERCAENVADIYFRTYAEKSTQLIFCDTSTPKQGFNIYDELKRLLVSQGVQESRIAYIHDAETEAERSRLFSSVRTGDIRVLIGSTLKLGLGVNIQDRLIALHHIDVPWRPADMTQREGRILRQGNTNPKISIYRYVTEGSFDAYSWQLLETKQRFISALLSGSLTERSGSDIDDTVLNYAEVKALAVGNPLVKKRVEAANELTKYQALQRKLVESRIRMEKEMMELPGRIAHQESLLRKCREDMDFCREWLLQNPPVEENRLKKEDAAKRRKLRESISEGVRGHMLEPAEKTITEYRGFSVVLPANMTPEKPYVWLIRAGKYYVELGNTEIGNLIRIDNRLDTLSDYLRDLENGLARLREKEAGLREELSRKEDYVDQIEEYKKKIEKLDKKLEVDKK